MGGWIDAIIEEYMGETEKEAANSTWGRRRAKILRRN